MIVYMFPGQGSQYKGMGMDLFKSFPRETEIANDILGYSIEELCLNDSSNRLQQTEYTQPALFFVSVLAYLQRLKEGNEKPVYVCGHSLGEYAALFAAGILDLTTGLSIVKKRGELMASVKSGAMMAVIGNDALNIGKILEDAAIKTIDIANFNSYQQVVLSGMKEDLKEIKDTLLDKEFRCIELNVSGAFHSRHMQSLRVEFLRFIAKCQFNKSELQVISSTTACKLEEDYILENLAYQLTKPVKWVQTIRYLDSLSAKTFIEVGPGEVLTNLTHKIRKSEDFA